MEYEGGRVSEGEQLRRRLPQITPRDAHLLDSWLHGGRWLWKLAGRWWGRKVALSGAVTVSSASFCADTVSTRTWWVEKHNLQSCRCHELPCRPVQAYWTIKVAFKDDVAVRKLDTWHAESASRGIASVMARNNAHWLVNFQWFDCFRTGVSPIRCTKRWDGADLTPNHRIIVSDRHPPHTRCGSCTINLTAGHPSAPKFGAALVSTPLKGPFDPLRINWSYMRHLKNESFWPPFCFFFSTQANAACPSYPLECSRVPEGTRTCTARKKDSFVSRKYDQLILNIRGIDATDLRQLRRGYRMWIICGSPVWFFKEATSTLWSFSMYRKGVGSLPHSLRIRLQCDGAETPDGAGDGAVRPRLRLWMHCRLRRWRRPVRTPAIAGVLSTAPVTVPCAYAFDRAWTAEGHDRSSVVKMEQKWSSVGGWVGGGGMGINGIEETRRGKGAGHVQEEWWADCPSQPVRPGIEGQRMPAIGGNSHVSYSWTAMWLRSPRPILFFDVGRRASLAIYGMEMWVQGLTWRETCPRPTPSTHIWHAKGLYYIVWCMIRTAGLGPETMHTPVAGCESDSQHVVISARNNDRLSSLLRTPLSQPRKR